MAGAQDAADEGEVEEVTYALLPPGWKNPTSGKKRDMAARPGVADDASSSPVLLVSTWSSWSPLTAETHSKCLAKCMSQM